MEDSSIVTAIVANIFLGAAISLQKYAKKQIILLALHGLPAVSFKRIWQTGLSLLFASECANFVTLGLVSIATMTPIGVFTVIANVVLPPLAFESHMHTIIGTCVSLPGILLLIITAPKTEPSVEGLILDYSSRVLITFEVVLGVVFALIQLYNPANCSLKLTATCGLGALMGSHTVTAFKALISSDYGENEQGVCVLVMAVTCALELILLVDSLQLFPVWQIVPHHFVMFIVMVYVNSGILFKEFDQVSSTVKSLSAVAYGFMTIGVWIAAKPHLDIPVDMDEDPSVLQQIARDAAQRCACESSSAVLSLENRQGSDSSDRTRSSSVTSATDSFASRAFIFDNDSLRREYARHKHSELKHQQGFRRWFRHKMPPHPTLP